MMGDIISWIKKVYKKQTCIHDYKWINASLKTNGSCPDFETCSKYGKIK